MVVAQLVERSLLIPEVRGSNSVIGKNSYSTFTVNCQEKEAGNGPFVKLIYEYLPRYCTYQLLFNWL